PCIIPRGLFLIKSPEKLLTGMLLFSSLYIVVSHFPSVTNRKKIVKKTVVRLDISGIYSRFV
ncbi:hypothetical protein P4538_08510, partial [Geobacillus stearothermophilus]|uniref:hypothetical protein n=1 Tax=Geobacillus stearothermophilus TaxID=1422 RepID=UPI002E248C5E|nr:hypothetical protein [Geobacillus stearothermophilus]